MWLLWRGAGGCRRQTASVPVGRSCRPFSTTRADHAAGHRPRRRKFCAAVRAISRRPAPGRWRLAVPSGTSQALKPRSGRPEGLSAPAGPRVRTAIRPTRAGRSQTDGCGDFVEKSSVQHQKSAAQRPGRGHPNNCSFAGGFLRCAFCCRRRAPQCGGTEGSGRVAGDHNVVKARSTEGRSARVR